MANEKKNEEVKDETGYISVDDLRDELAEEEKKKANKKECFFKRLFKKKEKESK